MGSIQSGFIAEQEKARLVKQFMRMDKDGSGELDYQELFTASALRNNPVVQRILDIFDKNKDKKISINEFTDALTVVLSGSSPNEKITFAFRFYDVDGDGFVSQRDLFLVTKLMVGNHLSDEQLNHLVARTFANVPCKDRNRGLDIEEFAQIVMNLQILQKLSVDFNKT